MDLEEKPHSLRDLDTGLRMKHLKLEGKEVPVYRTEEDMILRLTVDVAEPMEDILFRLTLRTDADVRLGTSWSESLSFEKTGTEEIVLAMPLGSIAKGNFYVSIGLYKYESFVEPVRCRRV